jgi:tRNA-dihydrouridine synthase
MYDVTDIAFRQVIADAGKPDVFFTEFISADGLVNAQGRVRLAHHLKFTPNQRPIVAQIFGSKPENFLKATQLIAELGFDGADLNTGCPDKNMMKQGSCAALYKNPELTKEILQAMHEGAGQLPVSVKIRIGDAKIDWENWIAALLQARPAAISIHLRTRKEASKVPAHWEEMPKIVEFINQNYNHYDNDNKTDNDNNPNHDQNCKPLIIGNGDVESLAQGKALTEKTGCDGIMIGRGIFHNPWLFGSNPDQVRTVKEKLELLKTHTSLFQQHFSGLKSDQTLKRFFKIYAHGFDGAAELREKLYNADNLNVIPKVIDDFLHNNPA